MGPSLHPRPGADGCSRPTEPGPYSGLHVQNDADCRDILSLPEFEERARRCMTPMAYEYVASGAADEHTVRWNREAFDRIRLRPRMLRDVGSVDTRVTLLGREHAFPILLAPTAYHRVLHPEGEIATARGAAAAGITWIVSIGTTTPIQEIAAAAAAPLWFQLYFQSDLAFTRDLVQQAEGSGCEVLCLTVDSPIIGPRNRQARAGFRLPPEMCTPHLYDIGQRKQAVMDPRRVAATWQDVEWLRGCTTLPLVLKGILDGADAGRGIQAGRRRSSSPTTAAGTWIPPSQRSTHCRRWSNTWAAVFRFSSTAASAAAPTSSRRSRSALPRC